MEINWIAKVLVKIAESYNSPEKFHDVRFVSSCNVDASHFESFPNNSAHQRGDAYWSLEHNGVSTPRSSDRYDHEVLGIPFFFSKTVIFCYVFQRWSFRITVESIAKRARIFDQSIYWYVYYLLLTHYNIVTIFHYYNYL